MLPRRLKIKVPDRMLPLSNASIYGRSGIILPSKFFGTAGGPMPLLVDAEELSTLIEKMLKHKGFKVKAGSFEAPFIPEGSKIYYCLTHKDELDSIESNQFDRLSLEYSLGAIRSGGFSIMRATRYGYLKCADGSTKDAKRKSGNMTIAFQPVKGKTYLASYSGYDKLAFLSIVWGVAKELGMPVFQQIIEGDGYTVLGEPLARKHIVKRVEVLRCHECRSLMPTDKMCIEASGAQTEGGAICTNCVDKYLLCSVCKCISTSQSIDGVPYCSTCTRGMTRCVACMTFIAPHQETVDVETLNNDGFPSGHGLCHKSCKLLADELAALSNEELKNIVEERRLERDGRNYWITRRRGGTVCLGSVTYWNTPNAIKIRLLSD